MSQEAECQRAMIANPQIVNFGTRGVAKVTMPRFTADASLYKTSGQYRTGRRTVNRSAQTAGPIWPAVKEQEGEVIHVHSCAPGWTDIGGTCWPDPLTEPEAGGGEPGVPGGSPGGESGEPGGGGGVSNPPKTPPKRPPRPPKDFKPDEGKPCHAELVTGWGEEVEITEPVVTEGTYWNRYIPPRAGEWRCISTKKEAYRCNKLMTYYDSKGNPIEGVAFCHNG
jgi:hypothetical protein